MRGHHFKIGATLGAGDDLAFINVVLLNIEIGFAFRTQHHKCLRSIQDCWTSAGLIFRVRSRPASSPTAMAPGGACPAERGTMNRSRTRVTGMGFLMAALVGAVALLCAAQAPRARMHHAPSAVARTEPDPQITAALKMVSAQKVRQDVEKLVSFYTRQTLSANQPEHTGWGIAAAREWIKSEFDNYSKACGGCLQVKTDIFVQPKSDRVPQPTQLVNVYAVLPGTGPEDEKRVFVVTGHYDSRNSDTFDAK